MKVANKWAAFVAACVGVGMAGSSLAGNIALHTFTDPHAVFGGRGGTIGFAYIGDGFVGSTYGAEGSLYRTDINGGNVTDFGGGTLTLTGPNVEHFVSSSIGYAFPLRDVYVSEGNTIIHVTHDGLTSNTFVSGLTGDVRGILFDSTGNFGHDMLVTTTTGTIYRINGAGVATVLANIGQDTEGLDIAPSTFGPYAGQLIVASEGANAITAISVGGVVSAVTSVSSAEELTFVPLNLGASGQPVEGFYGANFTPNVQKADTNQFDGTDPLQTIDMRGDAIVTGETSHVISRVHWDGSSFVVTAIGNFPDQPEDGIFVTAAIVQGSSVPLPGAAASGLALGVLGLSFRGFRRLRRR